MQKVILRISANYKLELKAKKYSELSDIRIFEVGKPVNKVHPEKFENIFYPLTQFNIRTIFIKRLELAALARHPGVVGAIISLFA